MTYALPRPTAADATVGGTTAREAAWSEKRGARRMTAQTADGRGAGAVRIGCHDVRAAATDRRGRDRWRDHGEGGRVEREARCPTHDGADRRRSWRRGGEDRLP